jgi:hypothetical protein
LLARDRQVADGHPPPVDRFFAPDVRAPARTLRGSTVAPFNVLVPWRLGGFTSVGCAKKRGASPSAGPANSLPHALPLGSPGKGTDKSHCLPPLDSPGKERNAAMDNRRARAAFSTRRPKKHRILPVHR